MKDGVMDAKVTVEEMVAAIGFAARVGTTEPPRRLLAAQQYILAAESRIAEAMSVLSPSMPESGLVDACRQVKQAAISEADNARDMGVALGVIDAMVRRGNGAVVFSETENGNIGIWIGDCDENTKALGAGDTAYEAITEAAANHPELGLGEVKDGE